jgi:hypothetical protein
MAMGNSLARTARTIELLSLQSLASFHRHRGHFILRGLSQGSLQGASLLRHQACQGAAGNETAPHGT